MKKERACKLLRENEFVCLAHSRSMTDIEKVYKMVGVLRSCLPKLITESRESATDNGDHLLFRSNRILRLDDFDTVTTDDHDKHIIYLQGQQYAGAFFIVNESVLKKLQKGKI